MKKTHSFLLAASIALAMAFTLSCSDDKDEGGNSSSSGGAGGGSSSSDGGGSPAIPPSTNANGDQAYEVSGEQAYILGLPSQPYGGSNILVGYNCGATGSIEKGKLSLNLPSIDSFNDDYDNEQGSCKEGFRVDIEGFPHYLQLYGTTKGLAQITAKDDVKAAAVLVYALRKEGVRLEGMDLNLEKGWNIVYTNTTGRFTLSTVPPSGLTWEWGLKADD